MLRILALGDAHFTKDNTIEVEAYLSALSEFLAEHQHEIDIIISMGDTLHTMSRLHIVPLNLAVRYFRMLSIKPLYLIVGNHDMISNWVFLTEDHWLNTIKCWPGVTVVDNVIIETINQVKLVFCPYVPDSRIIEALNTKGSEWMTADAIFSHVSVKGANTGNMIMKDCDEWKEEYPPLISGHIHLPQKIGSNVYYTGSIMQVATDEDPNKRIFHITLQSQKPPIVKEINLHLPRRERLYVEMDHIEDFKFPSEPNVKYTLYIRANKEDFRSFLKGSTYQRLLKLPQLDRGEQGIKFIARKEEIEESKQRVKEFKGAKVQRFNDLLRQTIEDENDPLLTSLYNHIINDNESDYSAPDGSFIVGARSTIPQS
jgi:DNA repair exonuclease SbcCD nuclease subunit